MPTRRYVSSVRTVAAAEKRDRVIEAAARLLREDASIASFSLDAVAKAAGVTRLTVYHQFGSRRGLLEAVFDDIARQGGLAGIADAMALPDPYAALDQLVEIFCAFWNSDPAVGRLHEAMATDPEFAQALLERNERRRKTFDALVRRAAGKTASPRARQDAVDMLFALTSFAMFAMLGRDRAVDEVCALVKSACRSALEPLLPDTASAAKRR
ncbi:MAG: TetR/AcrR family transcriptional regulator [Bradyrhizobium sp.]|nr:TetR/AcrR family transcriptional regulator [Bradyrhizobium sp.]